jgi:hypothetical protein
MILFLVAYSAVGSIMLSMVIGVGAGIGSLFIGEVTEESLAQNLPLLIVAGLFGAVIYVAFLLGFDLIRRLVFDRGVWSAAVNSVTVSNLAAIDHVVATGGGEVPSGIGEGLLDALDFGGGV